MKRTLLALLVGLGFSSVTHAQSLDKDEATVSMEVAKYAQITNLDDFILKTSDIDGSAGAVYSGFDDFNLESNTAVQVVLEGGELSNGMSTLATRYNLDGDEMKFSTAKGVHNSKHRVNAEAILGNISSQEAGGYKANILITVSALAN